MCQIYSGLNMTYSSFSLKQFIQAQESSDRKRALMDRLSISHLDFVIIFSQIVHFLTVAMIDL